MGKTLTSLALVLGLAAGLGASPALGQRISYTAGGQAGYAEISGGTTAPPSPFVAEDSSAKAKADGQKAAGDSACEGCGCGADSSGGNCGCGCGCGKFCPADCEACPNFGSAVFLKAESFRGVANGDYQNNDGMVLGANLGAPIPYLRDYGFGVQLGGSAGAYNLDGRTSPPQNVPGSGSEIEQQYFVTAGIFRRATEKMPFNFGVAHDWMITSGYSVFEMSPHLGQWRMQTGYCLNACNEFGSWFCLHDKSNEKTANTLFSGPQPITFRAIDQGDLFWHHNFENGADSWLWIGVPENERLNGDGSLGCLILGASAQVPFNDRVALTAEAQYMRPSANAGPAASIDTGYTISMGITFYPGSSVRNNSVAGKCWMPYMPVANNSNFLVDMGTVLPYQVP